MLDNGKMANIIRSVITDSLRRLSPVPLWRLPREKKSGGARLKRWSRLQTGSLPHQGRKEIARRKRQLDSGQLDFTASGQAHINGGSNYRTFLARVRYWF